MHPPLDRPHPECQSVIDELRTCHETRPSWKFWACNEMKANLDACFKLEKDKMLQEMNKDLDARRREEEAQAAISTGKNMTFQQYLAKDTTYHKEMKELKKKEVKGWFGF